MARADPHRRLSPMARTVLLYAAALAVSAGLIDGLNYGYVTRAVSGEVYVALLAIGFIALGIWVGRQLTPRSVARPFERNAAAIRSLGLTARECEILEQLASGASNKEMARHLGISPHTVKTHIARLYGKLDVQRRIPAVEKARFLALIPPA